MNRFIALLACCALSAPAFAQEWQGDDDYSWQAPSDEVDAPPPPPDTGPTSEDFRNDRELSWAGEWMDTPEYGTVWRPTHVDSDWRPYTLGRWEWTEAGWAWISEEPFGWATYHYGRWAYAGDGVGWLWLPGRVWAPAWVAFRWGDGYAGWCPLGPRAVVYEQPTRWVFVQQRSFLEPVRHHTVAISEVPMVWRRAHALPVGPTPHAGPAVAEVAHATGRTVRPLRIGEAYAPGGASVSSGSASFYRPHTAAVGRPHVRGGEQGGERRGGERHGDRGNGGYSTGGPRVSPGPQSSGGSVVPQGGDHRPHAQVGSGGAPQPGSGQTGGPHVAAPKPGEVVKPPPKPHVTHPDSHQN